MLSNYHKPTPRKWRLRGDTAILISLLLWVLEDFFTSAPESFLSPDVTHWIIKGIGAIAMIFKFYTNTKFDPSSLK
jgi:uncharacterized membrane-anchored protein